ncbi:MAG TPA: sulfite exporter TauE/SafE family protein [Xanthobacteraceae bacterium]|jgi:hypothetical protein|nr:sulfite exporter TauE/SafE family protein [Xanthobacteraceae bacterium]
MGVEQIALVFAGALAGGIVNGLTGFGTAITAMGLWLYAVPPTVAASLAVICSSISQLQTLHLIWRHILWRRLLAFIIPGMLGVPIGTFILPHIQPNLFRLGIGLFLCGYSAYVLARRVQLNSNWGGTVADGVIGFGGGVLGGIAGLSGVLPIIWTDVRGWVKEQRRAVVQGFNIAILWLAFVSHAASGLFTKQVLIQAAIALPGTIGGAWLGAFIYRRLHDHTYQRVVLVLLFISGLGLIWTSR